MWAKSLFLAALLALAVSAPPAAAQSRGPAIQPNWAMPAQDRGRDQDIMQVREVVAMLRNRFGGELVSARLEGGSRPFYVIRWRMPNDEYRDFTVDAVSGQIR
ncbi:MAG: PepSY domain-containing protein [Hyphomonadaceae bacterium]